jgi:hypothetical protein
MNIYDYVMLFYVAIIVILMVAICMRGRDE